MKTEVANTAKPELSIIVPVYNVGKYLPACLDSILNQTYKDFELILVNDGSPDNSGKICDEYAGKDNRIRVIHKENSGVSATRNAGLCIAKGKYVGFVDPDDWIEPDMYGDMISKINEDPAVDMVITGWKNIGEMDRTITSFIPPREILSLPEFCGKLLQRPSPVEGFVWNKIMRKTMICKPFSSDYAACEDLLFVFENAVHGNRFQLLDTASYNYLQRKAGASRIDKNILSAFSVRKKILEEIADLIRLGKIGDSIYDVAEQTFLDNSVYFCKNKRTLPVYKDVRACLLSYVKKHPLCCITNRQLSFRQKIYYSLFAVKLLIAG